MDFDSPSLIRLGAAADDGDFLQVLLRRFEIESRGTGGLVLRIALDASDACLEDSKAKAGLARELDFREGKRIESEVRSLRTSSAGNRRKIKATDFAFRHASAGVLPLLRDPIDRAAARVLLFERDIPPVGWNLANGASGHRAELTDPLRLMRRESAEELLFFDPEIPRLFALAPPGAYPELDHTIQMWSERLGAPAVATRPERPRWIDGPDRIEIRDTQGVETVTDGLWIGIHAEDFGIECIRGMEFEIEPGWRPLDGEIIDGRLLDRRIGIFHRNDLSQAVPAPLELYQGGESLEIREKDDGPGLCPVVSSCLT